MSSNEDFTPVEATICYPKRGPSVTLDFTGVIGSVKLDEIVEAQFTSEMLLGVVGLGTNHCAYVLVPKSFAEIILG